MPNHQPLQAVLWEENSYLVLCGARFQHTPDVLEHKVMFILSPCTAPYCPTIRVGV